MKMLNRYMSLFTGLKRSFYVHTPNLPIPNMMVSRPISPDDYSKHLSGETGITVVPINEDGNCTFAAIDIDQYDGINCHKDGKSLDIAKLAGLVTSNGLPLVPFSTKSDGIHLYWFLDEPTPAHIVRDTLKVYAKTLGLPTSGKGAVEIFPKQDKLSDGEGGSGINLPFFGGSRLPYINGEFRSIHEFFDHMYLSKSYVDAPPCIRHMMSDGIHEGSRNNTLHHISVFLKRKYKDMWIPHLKRLNSTLSDPLSIDELEATLLKGADKEYNYRCGDYRGESFCNPDVCRSTAYGVPDRPPQPINYQPQPQPQPQPSSGNNSSDLVIPASVVRYKAGIGNEQLHDLTLSNGVVLPKLTYDQLFSFQQVAKAYLSCGLKKLDVMAIYKQGDWFNLMFGLMQSSELVEDDYIESIESMFTNELNATIQRYLNDNGTSDDDGSLLFTSKESVSNMAAVNGYVVFKEPGVLSYSALFSYSYMTGIMKRLIPDNTRLAQYAPALRSKYLHRVFWGKRNLFRYNTDEVFATVSDARLSTSDTGKYTAPADNIIPDHVQHIAF